MLLFLIPIVFGVNVLFCIFLLFVTGFRIALGLVTVLDFGGRWIGCEKIIFHHDVRVGPFEEFFVNWLMKADQLFDLMMIVVGFLFKDGIVEFTGNFDWWVGIYKMELWLDLRHFLEVSQTIHPGVMVDVGVFIFFHAFLKMSLWITLGNWFIDKVSLR